MGYYLKLTIIFLCGVCLGQAQSRRVLRPENERHLSYPGEFNFTDDRPRIPHGNAPDRDLQLNPTIDLRVPFYNIAHMINSIEHIQPALSDGANGIETDVSFDSDGSPREAYHGFPCDCGRHCHYREDFIKFVKHIAAITRPTDENNLSLVLFDLKLKDLSSDAKYNSGKQLATILDQYLFSVYFREFNALRGSFGNFFRPPVRVVISINYVTDNQLVAAFVNYMKDNRLIAMRDHVGFDVGMNDNLTDINSMWNNFDGDVINIWQGDGLTNCANLIRGFDRLKEAIENRNNQGHFKKVYYWTVDIMYQIRTVFRLGLDAVLTNQPKRVVQVLEEPEFRRRFRMATVYDDPFAQFRTQATATGLSAPTISEAVETVTNIKKTSENFIKTLPDGIGAALKKIQQYVGF